MDIKTESLCHTPEINNTANQQFLFLFSFIQLFATPWTTACQASLSLSPGVFLDSCPCPLLISLALLVSEGTHTVYLYITVDTSEEETH